MLIVRVITNLRSRSLSVHREHRMRLQLRTTFCEEIRTFSISKLRLISIMLRLFKVLGKQKKKKKKDFKTNLIDLFDLEVSDFEFQNLNIRLIVKQNDGDRWIGLNSIESMQLWRERERERERQKNNDEI
ncbi:hypothetical protein SSS_10347 [Sarcoptes scabiei]|nr:hypothetical protein SSS_10347 [Sarcoptes scabiei]